MTLFKSLGSLRHHWFVAAESKDIGRKSPRRIMIWSVPLVLWRSGDHQVVAMVDRCPHRDVPLSRGSLCKGRIKCPYHGWEFAPDGSCVLAPALGGEASQRLRLRSQTLLAREQDGWIWVWLGDGPPTYEPPGLKAEKASGMRFLSLQQSIHAPAIDTIENFVDAPHTPFLHRGIIRGHHRPTKRRITVTADATSVLVTHAPSPEQVGPAGRLVNPTRAPVVHTDLFQMPALVRVDYQFGSAQRRFLALIFCTPETPTSTRVHLMLGLQFGWVTHVIKWILPWVARMVLWQDARLLHWQAANTKHFDQRSGGFLPSDRMHVWARSLWERALAEQAPSQVNREFSCELYV